MNEIDHNYIESLEIKETACELETRKIRMTTLQKKNDNYERIIRRG